MKETTKDVTGNEEVISIKNTYLWIAGGIFLAAGIAFLVGWQNQKKKKKTTASRQVLQASLAGGGGGLCQHGDGFPLKKGSCGRNVAALQKKLLARGFDPGDHGRKKNGVDGKFGKDTEAAVRKALGRASVTKADFQKL